MRSLRTATAILLALTVSAPVAARAQTANDAGKEKKTYSYEAGLFSGPLLPSEVPGVSEILPTWGGRASLRTRMGMIEPEFWSARGDAATYYSGSVDLRLQVSEELIPAHFLLGGHWDYYKGPREGAFKQAAGWHYGGGILYPIVEPLWFRFDFKYRFSPANSVLVLVGFTIRLADSGAGQ